MSNFFKKYWSHIFNILYLIFINCFLGFCIYGMSNEELIQEIGILPIMLLIELVLTFGVFGEMIYAIVKAAKDNELGNKAIHIVGLYFLNIFYIPCFLLNHIYKDEKTKIKNGVYILFIAILLIIFIALVGMLEQA